MMTINLKDRTSKPRLQKWSRSISNLSLDQESSTIRPNPIPKVTFGQRNLSIDNGLLYPNPKSLKAGRWRLKRKKI